MTDLNLNELSIANAERQKQWCSNGAVPDLSFRGNELAGEVGEACNIIKKLERERHGWPGSRGTVQQLASELADVVICTSLIANMVNIDLSQSVIDKFNVTTDKIGLSVYLGSKLSIRDQTRRDWHRFAESVKELEGKYSIAYIAVIELGRRIINGKL